LQISVTIEGESLHANSNSIGDYVPQHEDHVIQSEDRVTQHKNHVTQHENCVTQHKDHALQHEDHVTQCKDHVMQHKMTNNGDHHMTQLDEAHHNHHVTFPEIHVSVIEVTAVHHTQSNTSFTDGLKAVEE
jgi:archaellum component FlaD/FlaE